MCQSYLNESSPDAFVDFPSKKVPKGAKKCNRCKGRGGWNLRLNAYPLHQHKNTAKNRHLFSHFKASCSTCWGYGYITEGSESECPKPVKYIGHDFDGRWKCKQCGKSIVVDSSD